MVFAERRRVGMEQPESHVPPRPRSQQLALPLTTPGPESHAPPLPVVTVRTRQVWASLGVTGQAHLQQVLLRIVREVVHERSA